MNKLFKKDLIRNCDIFENLEKEIVEEMTYGMKDEFYEGGSFII